MKKKIKDLTNIEKLTICQANSCKNCPLYIPMGQDKCKDDLLDNYGEEEIEGDLSEEED